MAASAVNISSIQHKRPNIFELIAQESLMSHIHPALKSLCLYASEKNTSLFGPLLKWYDEVFFSANLVLQYYYLKAFNASFSEAFYGLRRIKSLSDSTKNKLPMKMLAASLVCLAVIPYIREKFTSSADSYEYEKSPDKSKRKEIFRKVMKSGKYLGSLYGTLRFYFIASYVAGIARVHDPLLKVSGVELVYHDRNLPSWKDFWMALMSGKDPNVRIKLALKLLGSSLEIGAFFIQFLSWWHSDESKVHRLTKLPVPKAPHINNGTVLCPICLRERKNEVVLMTSGYVFCYLCIKNYLEEKGICPVTNLPSNANHLVRIYSPEI